MDLTAILCNHVETPVGLLYVQGGGIDRVTVPNIEPIDWNINLALAISVSVDWDETNVEHTLVIKLKDIDGKDVLIDSGAGLLSPLRIEMKFSLGRPTALDNGESQLLNTGFNMPNLPIRSLGAYHFSCEVDGVEIERVRFKVIAS